MFHIDFFRKRSAVEKLLYIKSMMLKEIFILFIKLENINISKLFLDSPSSSSLNSFERLFPLVNLCSLYFLRSERNIIRIQSFFLWVMISHSYVSRLIMIHWSFHSKRLNNISLSTICGLVCIFGPSFCVRLNQFRVQT